VRVHLGLDRIEQFSSLFKNRAIGLVTNYSGVNGRLEENVGLFLKCGFSVRKLFAPEHGIYGIADGEGFSDFIHPYYQLPVVSLYGEKTKPTPEDLEGLDLLVYDIQDVGLRYYTFIYTLAYCLESAAERGIPVVVLDRPNPLGGLLISGNRIPEAHSSFVGGLRLPIRYGLTPGELARYCLREKDLQVDLSVVPMTNYTRCTYFPDTGLLWNVPSIALPTFESVVCYNGGCFVEGFNLSEGRGSPKPFQMYGAPWIEMNRLYRYMKESDTEGFAFRTRAFIPITSKYRNEVCFGLEFFPERKDADFIPVLLRFLKGVAETCPEQLQLVRYADVERLESLTGDPRVRDYLWGETPLDMLLNTWEIESSAFEEETSDIRMYP